MSGPFELVQPPVPQKPRTTENQIYLAIKEVEGNLAAASRILNITRARVKERIDASPNLRAALADIRESVVDEAEQNIFIAAKGGDLQSARFVLSTLGKDRGYTTRQTVAGDEDAPIGFKLIREIVRPMLKDSGVEEADVVS